MKKIIKKVFVILLIPFLLGLNSCKGKEVTVAEAKEIWEDILEYQEEHKEELEKMSFEFDYKLVRTMQERTATNIRKQKKDEDTIYSYSYFSISDEEPDEKETCLYVKDGKYYRDGNETTQEDFLMMNQVIISPIHLFQFNIENMIRLASIENPDASVGEYKFYSKGEGNLTVVAIEHTNGMDGYDPNTTANIELTFSDYVFSSYKCIFTSPEEKWEATEKAKYNVKVKNK